MKKTANMLATILLFPTIVSAQGNDDLSFQVHRLEALLLEASIEERAARNGDFEAILNIEDANELAQYEDESGKPDKWKQTATVINATLSRIRALEAKVNNVIENYNSNFSALNQRIDNIPRAPAQFRQMQTPAPLVPAPVQQPQGPSEQEKREQQRLREKRDPANHDF